MFFFFSFCFFFTRIVFSNSAAVTPPVPQVLMSRDHAPSQPVHPYPLPCEPGSAYVTPVPGQCSRRDTVRPPRVGQYRLCSFFWALLGDPILQAPSGCSWHGWPRRCGGPGQRSGRARLPLAAAREPDAGASRLPDELPLAIL